MRVAQNVTCQVHNPAVANGSVRAPYNLRPTVKYNSVEMESSPGKGQLKTPQKEDGAGSRVPGFL